MTHRNREFLQPELCEHRGYRRIQMKLTYGLLEP
jgi:hypothetical protein